MNDISKLLIGILVGAMAQVLTFIQLQGQMKWEWVKNHYWTMALLGVPVSILFMYSVKNLVIAFNGQMWPSRLIGFSIGTIVFTIMSVKLLNEPLTTNTVICLCLSFTILGLQLFAK